MPIAPEAIAPAPEWRGRCIVAAPGPSLTEDVAEICAGHPTIVVNDAYRRLPVANLLYACDAEWWRTHDGARDFGGERWSSHGDASHNDKRPTAGAYGVKLIRGRHAEGFSRDPAIIHYGDNSGFQAVNIAAHKLAWSGTILLVGFDMRRIDGRSHFFGEHPPNLRTTFSGYSIWPRRFAVAAQRLPPALRIVNCTPGSALICFPTMDLADALSATA